MQRLSVFTMLCCVLGLSANLTGAEKPTPHESTHKQVSQLTPKHEGRLVDLKTFTLDTNGNVLACVVDSKTPPETDSNGAASWLQVYSPDGDLVRETALPFIATAINEAPSGIVFLAGSGQVGKVGAEGKLLATADAPHLGDKDALRKQAEKDAVEQMKQVTEMFASQITRLDKMIEDIEGKEDATDRDAKRLKSLQTQKKMFADQQADMEKTYSQFFSVDALLANAMQMTSLAVNSKDVFLCCSTGMGYDVWRTDHDFSSPSKVVSGLSGCCGQCDIQADEDNLILAENTKFKVSLLDREGKRLTSFGSRAGESGEGFGSCCNPMNVRCCSNGDILTAESSIGLIKRFNKDGDFLGTIGKAKIGGGCKHVAIGFDEKRDRYYMQYQDKNSICVMWPLAEAPEFTADELEAKAAMEGLGQLLMGDGETKSNEWSVGGKKPAAMKQSGFLAALSGSLMEAVEATAEESGTDEEAVEIANDAVKVTIVEQEKVSGEANADEELAVVDVASVMNAAVNYFKFAADGKLEIRGGYSEQGNNGWITVSQDLETKTLIISQLEDGIQYYNYKIKFVDDDTAAFTMMYGDQEVSTQTLKRVPMSTK